MRGGRDFVRGISFPSALLQESAVGRLSETSPLQGMKSC